MYLMYVDESGDVGLKPNSSDWFALSAMVIHDSVWLDTLSAIADFRREVGSKYGYSMAHELHASHLLGRLSVKDQRVISRYNAVRLLRETLQFEAHLESVRCINILVDKRSRKGTNYDVFTHAWNALFNRFENTIKHCNFPTSSNSHEKGMVIVDKTDEKKLMLLMRNMRKHNILPDTLHGGSYTSNLTHVIEDPLHKDSKSSLPIQLCDVNGYFLIQTTCPNATVKKNKAHNYFYLLDPILLKQASKSDPHGIVRL